MTAGIMFYSSFGLGRYEVDILRSTSLGTSFGLASAF